MPVPFRLGGGQGTYQGQSYSFGNLSDSFEDLLNEGRLKSQPMVDFNRLQPLTKQGVGNAFQNLLNDVSSNPASLTPGYDPVSNTGGHHPNAQQLLGAFTGGGLNFADETGTVSLVPGGMNVRSNKGWSAGVNPIGGNINVGPFGLQGTWAGDKSVQATVNIGRKNELIPGMFPPGVSEFIGQQQVEPSNIYGPVPLSAGRALMEQQTEDYIRRNPNYLYQ
jgi:hypothetical protein